MRIAFTGVSHWHLPLYLDPLLGDSNHTLVGMADPDLALAQAAATRAGCPAWQDWQEMVEQARPDFVFVLGRHCDMAEVVRGLIERRIPQAVEKPAGMTAEEIGGLARAASAAGSFVAIPFVFRQSRMLEAIAERAPGEAVLSMAYKFIAGPVERYLEMNSAWNLERRFSAGGCILNLGVHFVDLARLMLGGEVRVEGAMMSNDVSHLDTEDHGVVLLRGGTGSCLVETGYLYPSRHMSFDMHFSIRTERTHFAAKDDQGLTVTKLGGQPEYLPMPMSNVPYYPPFVRDVLQRAAEGRPPLAGLEEMEASMRLIEQAYAMAPLPAPKPAR